VPRNKVGIRDYLRREGREPEWTAFQGELYGPGMRYAEPFEGAIETMARLTICTHELVIVSHRSLKPYAGPAYNLHQAARDWIATNLQKNGLFLDGRIYFLETQDAKIAKIEELRCDVFLDDLPEVLESPYFPENTTKLLFDPNQLIKQRKAPRNISHWNDLQKLFDSII
jgi:hypothetical protein